MRSSLHHIQHQSIFSATETCFEIYYTYVASLHHQLKNKKVICMETFVEQADQTESAVLVAGDADQDSTVEIMKSRREPNPKPTRIKKKSHSIYNPNLEHTFEHISKSASKDISPSKKDFHEMLQQLEKEETDHVQGLFFFQPLLETTAQRLQQPYLPPLAVNSKIKYTLVLDLDETLVHFEENEERTGGQFHVRPFAVDFLKQMARYYELVIFTAAVKEVSSAEQYADWILDKIDEDHVIPHRLYRQHTLQNNNIFLKDLSLLGRDIRKCIIVDNNAENFQLHNENGIFIRSWYGDSSDQALFKLAPILKGTPDSPRNRRSQLHRHQSRARESKGSHGEEHPEDRLAPPRLASRARACTNILKNYLRTPHLRMIVVVPSRHVGLGLPDVVLVAGDERGGGRPADSLELACRPLVVGGLEEGSLAAAELIVLLGVLECVVLVVVGQFALDVWVAHPIVDRLSHLIGLLLRSVGSDLSFHDADVLLHL